MKVKLVVIGGKKAGMEIPVSTPTFLIGRGDKCHIRPQDNFVNLVHCQISVDKQGSAAIEDSSGAVGTFVNGEKIKWRYTLKHGDRIKISSLEFELRYVADEEPEKKPVPKAAAAATRRDASVDDHEPDISTWIGPPGQEENKEKRNTLSTPVKLPVAANTGTPQTAAPVASAVESRRPERSRGRGMKVEYDVADLLLATTIGIMLIVVLCMMVPAISWPDWHWHPVRWYWTRLCWYWTYQWWLKLSVMGTIAFMLALLLWIRTRLLRKAQA
jgi:pSer/pThr/pTyr-binding forkhead associated (FHA) protein